MRTKIKWLLVAGIVFQFMVSPVYGSNKYIITMNQLRANEYISQLKAGVDPKSLTRPYLRSHHNYKVKRSRREIRKALDIAEALSRAGKYHLIQEPEYVFKGMSEESTKALQYGKKKQ